MSKWKKRARLPWDSVSATGPGGLGGLRIHVIRTPLDGCGDAFGFCFVWGMVGGLLHCAWPVCRVCWSVFTYFLRVRGFPTKKSNNKKRIGRSGFHPVGSGHLQVPRAIVIRVDEEKASRLRISGLVLFRQTRDAGEGREGICFR